MTASLPLRLRDWQFEKDDWGPWTRGWKGGKGADSKEGEPRIMGESDPSRSWLSSRSSSSSWGGERPAGGRRGSLPSIDCFLYAPVENGRIGRKGDEEPGEVEVESRRWKSDEAWSSAAADSICIVSPLGLWGGMWRGAGRPNALKVELKAGCDDGEGAPETAIGDSLSHELSAGGGVSLRELAIVLAPAGVRPAQKHVREWGWGGTEGWCHRGTRSTTGLAK